MVQSPMGTRLALGRRRRVQFGIFLNQGIDFEYTQLLPGVEMIGHAENGRKNKLENHRKVLSWNLSQKTWEVGKCPKFSVGKCPIKNSGVGKCPKKNAKLENVRN